MRCYLIGNCSNERRHAGGVARGGHQFRDPGRLPQIRPSSQRPRERVTHGANDCSLDVITAPARQEYLAEPLRRVYSFWLARPGVTNRGRLGSEARSAYQIGAAAGGKLNPMRSLAAGFSKSPRRRSSIGRGQAQSAPAPAAKASQRGPSSRRIHAMVNAVTSKCSRHTPNIGGGHAVARARSLQGAHDAVTTHLWCRSGRGGRFVRSRCHAVVRP
jgi:hypothetical protein